MPPLRSLGDRGEMLGSDPVPDESEPLDATPNATAGDAPPAAQERAQPNDLEAELVARAREGDADAWARLYQERHDWLLREVTFLVGDVSLAEDMVQETFARTLASLPSYEGRSGFSNWIRGIALNLCRQHWRSAERGRRALENLRHAQDRLGPPTVANPEASELVRRRSDALRAVLDTIPAHLRAAFVLCDLKRCSPREAAALLEISEGNVRVRATRARARIRRELVRLGWRDDPDHPDESGGAP